MSACLKAIFMMSLWALLKSSSWLARAILCITCHAFFLCACPCSIYGFVYSHKYSFLSFSVLENQCHLGIYKNKLIAKLLSRWKCLMNFGIHWRDLPQMCLTQGLQPRLYLYMRKCSFHTWNFAFHCCWAKKLSLSSPPSAKPSWLWWMQFRRKMDRVQLFFPRCIGGPSTSVPFSQRICPSPCY